MKKVFLIIFILLFLVGCEDNVNVNKTQVKEDTFILKKIDESKEYVYFTNYKGVLINNEKNFFEIPVINVVSDEVDNLNLELKSFVVKSYKDSTINNGVLIKGRIIDYKSFVTDSYLSIVQTYHKYMNGVVGEENDNVYVVSLDTGKVLSNNKILNNFKLDEKELYTLLESKIKSDDVSYTLMNVRNNGYKLYVNNDNKLCVIYYEVTDYNTERKELVLN